MWLAAADVPFNYAAGQWYHVACVVAPQGYEIYVNGERKGAGAFNGIPLLADANHRLRIGANGSGETWNGVLDEVAVYGRALPAAEVRHIGQAAVAGVQSVDVALVQPAQGGPYSEMFDGWWMLAYLPFDDAPDDSGTVAFKDIAQYATSVITCTAGASACPTTGVPGMVGTAAFFNGVDNQGLNTAVQSWSSDDSFTVAAWVKPNHASNTLMIMSSHAPSNYGFALKLMGGNKIRAEIGDGTKWLNATADTAFNYTVGQWYYIASVITPTGYVVYVNGEPRGSGTFAAGGLPVLANATHVLRIGADGTGGRMNGALDEVRIFRAAWSREQIKSLYLGNGPLLALDFENSLDDGSIWARRADSAPAAQSPRLAADQGKTGLNSAVFDGVDDAVTFSQLPVISFTMDSSSFAIGNGFSVAAWAKPNHATNAMAVFGASAASYTLALKFQDGNKIRGQIGDGSKWVVTMDAPFTYTVGQWYHVALVVVRSGYGANYNLYVNGEEKATTYLSSVGLRTGDVLFVGRNGNGEYWNGALDDVRVYLRPLDLWSTYQHLPETPEIRGLAGGYRSATLSGAGGGSIQARWTITTPMGLEGFYRLDARAQDANGQVSQKTGVWSGMVDTLAPRVYSYGSSTQADSKRWDYSATDLNLSVESLRMSATCLETGSARPYVSPYYRLQFLHEQGLVSHGRWRPYALQRNSILQPPDHCDGASVDGVRQREQLLHCLGDAPALGSARSGRRSRRER